MVGACQRNSAIDAHAPIDDIYIPPTTIVCDSCVLTLIILVTKFETCGYDSK